MDEFGRIDVVGVNPPDLRCGQIHLVGLFVTEECIDCGLAGQVEFHVSSGDDVTTACLFQLSDNRRANHSAMACDVDFFILSLHDEPSLGLSPKRCCHYICGGAAKLVDVMD